MSCSNSDDGSSTRDGARPDSQSGDAPPPPGAFSDAWSSEWSFESPFRSDTDVQLQMMAQLEDSFLGAGLRPAFDQGLADIPSYVLDHANGPSSATGMARPPTPTSYAPGPLVPSADSSAGSLRTPSFSPPLHPPTFSPLLGGGLLGPGSLNSLPPDRPVPSPTHSPPFVNDLEGKRHAGCKRKDDEDDKENDHRASRGPLKRRCSTRGGDGVHGDPPPPYTRPSTTSYAASVSGTSTRIRRRARGQQMAVSTDSLASYQSPPTSLPMNSTSPHDHDTRSRRRLASGSELFPPERLAEPPQTAPQVRRRAFAPTPGPSSHSRPALPSAATTGAGQNAAWVPTPDQPYPNADPRRTLQRFRERRGRSARQAAASATPYLRPSPNPPCTEPGPGPSTSDPAKRGSATSPVSGTPKSESSEAAPGKRKKEPGSHPCRYPGCSCSCTRAGDCDRHVLANHVSDGASISCTLPHGPRRPGSHVTFARVDELNRHFEKAHPPHTDRAYRRIYADVARELRRTSTLWSIAEVEKKVRQRAVAITLPCRRSEGFTRIRAITEKYMRSKKWKKWENIEAWFGKYGTLVRQCRCCDITVQRRGGGRRSPTLEPESEGDVDDAEEPHSEAGEEEEPSAQASGSQQLSLPRSSEQGCSQLSSAYDDTSDESNDGRESDAEGGTRAPELPEAENLQETSPSLLEICSYILSLSGPLAPGEGPTSSTFSDPRTDLLTQAGTTDNRAGTSRSAAVLDDHAWRAGPGDNTSNATAYHGQAGDVPSEVSDEDANNTITGLDGNNSAVYLGVWSGTPDDAEPPPLARLAHLGESNIGNVGDQPTQPDGPTASELRGENGRETCTFQ